MMRGDRADPGVMAVALQQLLHEREKAWVRMHVVLQHDPLRFVLEKPANGGGHPGTATLVAACVAMLNLHWPGEPLIHQVATTLHEFLVQGVIGSGAITGEVDPLRLENLEDRQKPI